MFYIKKKKIVGNIISKANNKTKRLFLPNIYIKSYYFNFNIIKILACRKINRKLILEYEKEK